jgi:hypothetical protein
VLDLDPPNSEFGLRLKDFGWKPSFVLEFGRNSIPFDSVGLRLQIRRYSISKGRFIFTYDLVAIPWLIREIGQREGGVDLQGVELGLQEFLLVDSPRVHGGRSVRSLTAHVFFVFFASSCMSFVRSFLSVVFCCTKFADGPY